MLSFNTNIFMQKILTNSSLFEKQIQYSIESLSSGKRVNSAKDDAAGLSISTRFQSQVRGNDKAIENISHGISLAKVADGGLSSVEQILQRTRELLLQAGNGTYSSDDRNAVQAEIHSLIQEIDQIALKTNVNGIKPLFIEEVIIPSLDIVVEVEAGSKKTAGTVNVPPGSPLLRVDAFFGTISGVDFPDLMLVSPDGASFGFTKSMLTDSHSASISGSYSWGTKATYSGWSASDEYMEIENPMAGKWTIEIGNSGGNSKSTFGVQSNLLITPDFTVGSGTPSLDINIPLHTGYESDDTFIMKRFNAHSSSLGIDSLSMETSASISSSIQKIDIALNKVSSARAQFGSYINVLEEKNSFLDTSITQTSQSNSRIIDANMSTEMSELMKLRVLNHTSLSMLSHSNQNSQLMLNLLDFYPVS